MRPPHYTGEDQAADDPPGAQIAASMRPPHYTGEDVSVEDFIRETPALQ